MFDISEELKKLPEKSGVYFMKNAEGTVLYVGKAVHLKNRVKQYFQNTKKQNLKTQKLVSQIHEFEYMVTDTEIEALLLECTMIKEYKPYYNILLKDDKTYPYIKITTQEVYPRIFITREVKQDKAKYYGPYTDASALREILNMLENWFPIRKCKKQFPRDFYQERPCLNYDIKQCFAPCHEKISREDYQEYIKQAMHFLEGKHKGLYQEIEKKMQRYASEMNFEEAILCREQLKAIEILMEKQKVNHTSIVDGDVIGMACFLGRALVQVFFVRNGKVIGREQFSLTLTEEQSNREILTAFVTQFYSGTAYIPKEIILQEQLLEEDSKLLEHYFSDKRGSKVKLVAPIQGEKEKLLSLAKQNAHLSLEQFGEKLQREEKRTKAVMKQLQFLLGLEKPVVRVEAYDISHIQGVSMVGSMVVFHDGSAKKSDYRKFRIQTVEGANEFASMTEMLSRRFSHVIKETQKQKEAHDNNNGKEKSFTQLPDLILMDGGEIQIQATKKVLQGYGMEIAVCGMVKDEKHRTRALLYEGKELRVAQEVFLWLERVQNEVHRFAINYHRKLHETITMRSVLDDIKGIGEKRRNALLKHFGSIDRIKEAEVSELLEVVELTIQNAEAVYCFFRGEELL